MKAVSILARLLLELTINLDAQNLIAVQNGNPPNFYSNLDSAIIHAQNGDTIYIPGGPWWNISQPVNKRLHIFGVGHNPDSTLATGQTRINGTLSLVNEASNGSLISVYLASGISSGDNISNYQVQRCRVNSLSLVSTSTNWSFIENIIQGSVHNGNNPAANCFFSNNIIDASFSNYYTWCGFTSSVFKNNIFLFQGICGWDACNIPVRATTSTFENNIFISTAYTCHDISNSSLNNNLFVEMEPLYWCSECWGSNNIVFQSLSSIFINQTGNTFNYTHDYHLQPTSPGKNAGKDGTDVGIYGGAFPWKAGSLPVTPHIQFENVSGGTDQNGNLNVNIKVAAQDH